MDVKDLRVGNLINNGEVVESIYFSGMLDTDKLSVSCEHAKPIPLTAEWLERGGFEKQSVTYYKNGVRIGMYKDGFYYMPTIDLLTRGVKVEYVHDLQSLYWVLTKEELEFKEV